MGVLEEFEIPLDHVITAVTDNAANMIKIVKDFNIDLAAAVPGPSTQSSQQGSDDDTDTEENQDEEEDQLQAQLENSMPISISHVRCGVHTLQLAIMDGLKNPSAASLVRRIRHVAVELRTPKLAEKLKKEGKLMAVLDQTRWGSTFLMLDRVLLLKSFVNESVEIYQKGINITAPQWKQIQELRDMLKKSYEVTKKMQMEDLTPGYFYRKWSGLQSMMEVHSGIIADIIFASMKKRESELMNNSLFVAAIYLDVTSMDLLTPPQKDLAKETVVELVIRLEGLNDAEDEDPDSPTTGTVPSSADSDSDEEMNAARKASRSQDTSACSEPEIEEQETEVFGEERTSSRARGERLLENAEKSRKVKKFTQKQQK